jgi:ATP-dependent Lon protease
MLGGRIGTDFTFAMLNSAERFRRLAPNVRWWTGRLRCSRGNVLPIGDVKQKVLAAHSAGLTQVIPVLEWALI